MKKLLFALLLFAGVVHADMNFMSDIQGLTPSENIVLPAATASPPDSNEVTYQCTIVGSFSEYLLDFPKKACYIKGDNYLTRDFWVYQAIDFESKTFESSGASENCSLGVYQVNLDGSTVDAIRLNKADKVSFSLSRGDTVYLTVSPKEKGLCSFNFNGVNYKIDFQFVESSEQYVNTYKYPCREGQECFKTTNGEEVNVTEWLKKKCPFDYIRQGNAACQDWFTSKLELDVNKLETEKSDLNKQTQPVLAEKLDAQNTTLMGLVLSVEKNEANFWGMSQNVIIGIIVFLGVMTLALYAKKKRDLQAVEYTKPIEATVEVKEKIQEAPLEPVVEERRSSIYDTP